MSQSFPQPWQRFFAQAWVAVGRAADKWGRSTGGDIPSAGMPVGSRLRLESAFYEAHGSADLSNPSQREMLLGLFTNLAFAAFQATALGVADQLLSRMGRKRAVRGRRSRGPEHEDRPLRPQAHAYAYDVAWFVAERAIPFVQILIDYDLRPGHHGPKRGTPWALLCEEWNRRPPQPWGRFSSGRVLKDTYFRAIRNDHVHCALIDEAEQEYDAATFEEFGREPDAAGLAEYKQEEHAVYRGVLLAEAMGLWKGPSLADQRRYAAMWRKVLGYRGQSRPRSRAGLLRARARRWYILAIWQDDAEEVGGSYFSENLDEILRRAEQAPLRPHLFPHLCDPPWLR